MVSGNATTRVVPTAGGKQNLDPKDGPVQPAQWTCPRSGYNPPSWPAGSDGSKAGIQDPNNQGQGVGFPFANCDGYASPLRADVHFPSCYNPAAGLTNFRQNMAWPTSKGSSNGRRQNCPAGWIHVPHIFFEVYWNTPLFKDRWTPNQGYQPFVLANGDVTGFSSHGDFLAAWDEELLQHIIDTCDAGSRGMDNCAGLKYGLNDEKEKCTIPSQINEVIDGVLDKLPGNNPLAGWKYGAGSGAGAPAPAPVVPAPEPPVTPPKENPKPAPAPPPPTTPKEDPKPAPAPEKPNTPSPVIVTPTQKPTTSATVPPVVNKPANPSACSVKIETVWQTVTVFGTATPSATPVVNATGAVAGFKFAGCFKDADTRVLSGEIRPNIGAVSNEKCFTYCKGAGFALAGTEYGGQCYCGNELVGSEKLDESKCNMACEGDAKSKCGGGWALSVFSADGLASMKSSKARRHVHNHAVKHRSARK
jgi:hypothetical protein